jgi:hypothetical protein
VKSRSVDGGCLKNFPTCGVEEERRKRVERRREEKRIAALIYPVTQAVSE